jgi:hypothetical protein
MKVTVQFSAAEYAVLMQYVRELRVSDPGAQHVPTLHAHDLNGAIEALERAGFRPLTAA